MSARSDEQAQTELRPRHCTVAECECEQHQWNGRPSALKADPPSTCVCGHVTHQHSFLPRTRPGADS